MTPKLYAKRDPEAQGEFYQRHLAAMTAEGLHDKCDIACELAHRDQVIVELLDVCRGWESQYDGFGNALLIAHTRAAIALAEPPSETEGASRES